MQYQNISRRNLLAGFATGISIAGVSGPVSIAKAATGAKSANLGFGLWCGVPGAKFGSKVDAISGSRRIKGPLKWKHPITGKTLTIYVRTNGERNGAKVQYYTMRKDGSALARVFDRRPGQADRHFVGDAFFPLGNWQDNQVRKYKLIEYRKGRAKKFRTSLTVLRSSYGVRGSVEFDWISKKGTGRTVFHERYVYTPGIGFVDYSNLL